MADDSFPERKVRADSHVPPAWVPNEATFFITVSCKPRGKDQLTVGTIPRILFQSVEFLQGEGKWFPELVLLMPDHLHLLVSFSWEKCEGMSNVLKNWKRYLARTAGIEWQRDYFDHRIRSEDDHSEKWDYIRENPVKAGLVKSFDEWPYVWRPELGLGW